MKIPEKTEILINATSVGFSPDVNSRPDIDYNTVSANMCVCDVVFNPAETLFLKAAEEKGAKTVNGLGIPDRTRKALASQRPVAGQRYDRDRKSVV